MDQAIQQAQRQGQFDNLPGTGKPLRGLDRPHDPDWWVKGLIEREKLDLTDALPGPLALRRERAAFPHSLLHLRDEAPVRAHLEDFNERVLADRRRPYPGTGTPPVAGRVDVEEMVQSWRVAKAAQLLAAEVPGEDVPGDAGPTPGAARSRWWSRRRRT